MFDLETKLSTIGPLFQALTNVYDLETITFLAGQTKLFFCLEDVLKPVILPIDQKVTGEDCLTYVGVAIDHTKPRTKKQFRIKQLVDLVTVLTVITSVRKGYSRPVVL